MRISVCDKRLTDKALGRGPDQLISFRLVAFSLTRTKDSKTLKSFSAKTL